MMFTTEAHPESAAISDTEGANSSTYRLFMFFRIVSVIKLCAGCFSGHLSSLVPSGMAVWVG